MTARLLNFASESNAALKQNAAHVFAATHALSIYRANAIYTFIPKNACSTLRYSIAVANGAIPKDGDPRWIHKNNGTFMADLRALATADYTFVILRCPFERMASAYLDKVVDGHHVAWTLVPSSETDLKPVDMSFRQFVTLLQTKRLVDPHWRAQADFLVYRTYDRYFDFADMADVYDELSNRIGLELIDMRPHAISALERLDGDFADTPAHELLAMKREGKVPSLASLFDESLSMQFANLYRSDVVAYTELAGGKITNPHHSTR